MSAKVVKVNWGRLLSTSVHYFLYLGWSTGVSFVSAFNRVKMYTCPLSYLCFCLSLSLPSFFHPSTHTAFTIPPSSLTSTQGWECRLESSVASNERHMVQNHVMTRLSLTHLDSGFPFCLLTPSTSLLSALNCPRLSGIHSSAPGEWFSPCSHLYTHSNGSSVSFCISLNLLLFSSALFPTLFFSVCTVLSLTPPFIARAVKSDRLDKCGSMVTQIPEASERAKINHFSPSLSSAISLSLCLCSPLFLLQSSRSSVRSILVIILFWLSFNISFLFQYVASD